MSVLTTPNQPATDLLHTSLLYPCDSPLAVIKLGTIGKHILLKLYLQVAPLEPSSSMKDFKIR